MNFAKIAQDPYYTQIIFNIESVIHEFDTEAKADGLDFKDSEVKSILQKSLGFAKGKRPSVPKSNEKEKRLWKLLSSLLALNEALKSEEFEGGIQQKDWIIGLRAVDDSLKTRREMHGHSRGYLDFLDGFMEEADL